MNGGSVSEVPDRSVGVNLFENRRRHGVAWCRLLTCPPGPAAQVKWLSEEFDGWLLRHCAMNGSTGRKSLKFRHTSDGPLVDPGPVTSEANETERKQSADLCTRLSYTIYFQVICRPMAAHAWRDRVSEWMCDSVEMSCIGIMPVTVTGVYIYVQKITLSSFLDLEVPHYGFSAAYRTVHTLLTLKCFIWDKALIRWNINFQ